MGEGGRVINIGNQWTGEGEAIRYSETSVHTRSTRRHIPENGILHTQRRENLKSYKSYNIQNYIKSSIFRAITLCSPLKVNYISEKHFAYIFRVEK
jgi:hypothetical protein